MIPNPYREAAQALEEYRDDAYEALIGAGGGPSMISTFSFEDLAQAFYGGQLLAMNNWLPIVAEALGRAEAADLLA